MDDPWKAAHEIENLQREVSAIASTYYKDESVRREVDQKNEKARALGEQLAKQFGTLHGWKLTRRPFSLDQLAENRKARNWRGGEFFQGGTHLDHPFWYRLNGFPIAVAVHNYNAPDHRGDLDEECKRRGLVWEEVSDFPSWHNPGDTKLILITRPQLTR